MRNGPELSQIASLIGDPARANMLTALLSGKALTASELAAEAGLTRQTASSHLSKLLEGGLLSVEKQGRHRYFRLSGEEVVSALEALCVLSSTATKQRVRTGPRDEAMRKARVCYDHLAGELGVFMFDRLVERSWLELSGDGVSITPDGEQGLKERGVPLDSIKHKRRVLCRTCLDWSERRQHLAGSLGAALFICILDANWARREAGSRAVLFTGEGEVAFRRWLK